MTLLEAGRELDALVAEKVMGWRIVGSEPKPTQVGDDGDVWPNGDPRWYYTDDLTRPLVTLRGVPCYSTSIAAAWEVVEKLRETVTSATTICWSDQIESWECELVVTDAAWKTGLRSVVEYAPTAPHAICLAALKAVEGQP